jgi:hypothetical protein
VFGGIKSCQKEQMSDLTQNTKNQTLILHTKQYNTGNNCGKYKRSEQRICAARVGFQTGFNG